MSPDGPELVEYELGPAALDWIRYALEQGIGLGHVLSETLLTRFEADPPRVTTFLPPGQDGTSLHQFKQGGKLPPAGEPIRFSGGRLATGEAIPFTGSGIMVPTPTTGVFLEGVVRDFLQASPRNLLLVECGFATAGDPWVQAADLPVLVAGDNVYYFANSSSTDNALSTAVNSTTDVYPPGVGILTTFSDDPQQLLGVTHVSPAVLNELAAKASLVLIGAYDGEGVLFWRPPLSQAT